MKSIILLFVAALASVAISSPVDSTLGAQLVERQSTQYVRDGSFETVPNKSLGIENPRAGGWHLKDMATFSENYAGEEKRYATPYGSKYVQFDPGYDYVTGSAAQQLAGLTSGTYTLTYYYKNVFPFVRNCTITTSYASQTLDTVVLPSTDPYPPPMQWTKRSVSFDTEAASGKLEFYAACGRPTTRGIYSFYLDNISLTGAASS